MTSPAAEYPHLHPQNHLNTVSETLLNQASAYVFSKTEYDLYHSEEHGSDTVRFSLAVVESEEGIKIFDIEKEIEKYNATVAPREEYKITLQEFKALFPTIMAFHDSGNLLELNEALIKLLQTGDIKDFLTILPTIVESPDDYVIPLPTSNEEKAEKRSQNIYQFSLKYTLAQLARAGVTKFGESGENLDTFYNKASFLAEYILKQTVYNPGQENIDIPFSSITKFADRVIPYVVSRYPKRKLVEKLCNEKISEGRGNDSIRLLDVILYPQKNFELVYPDPNKRAQIQNFLKANFGKVLTYLRSDNLISPEQTDLLNALVAANTWIGVLNALNKDPNILKYFN